MGKHLVVEDLRTKPHRVRVSRTKIITGYTTLLCLTMAISMGSITGLLSPTMSIDKYSPKYIAADNIYLIYISPWFIVESIYYDGCMYCPGCDILHEQCNT